MVFSVDLHGQFRETRCESDASGDISYLFDGRRLAWLLKEDDMDSKEPEIEKPEIKNPETVAGAPLSEESLDQVAGGAFCCNGKHIIKATITVKAWPGGSPSGKHIKDVTIEMWRAGNVSANNNCQEELSERRTEKRWTNPWGKGGTI
jgi:hypothetical protein